jgi:hypothetical protein
MQNRKTVFYVLHIVKFVVHQIGAKCVLKLIIGMQKISPVNNVILHVLNVKDPPLKNVSYA